MSPEEPAAAPIPASSPELEADRFSDEESLISDYSDSTSISSSVLNYQYENGRRYHNYRSGNYLMPNDEQEQDRLDLTHHLWMLMLDGETHEAPLKEDKLRRVADLGCGTGIWAIDFGDTYPEAEVIGLDLSPIQPSWVPPNVKFVVDDIEDLWTWDPSSFDYIHGRALAGSIKDWEKLAEQIFTGLAPGGYVEFQEGDMSGQYTEDGSDLPDGAFALYKEKIAQASGSFGARMDVVPEIASILRKAGFVDVVEKKIKTPIGTWPRDRKLKEIGAVINLLNDGTLEAYGLALFTRVLGMSEKEAKEVIDAAVKDLKNTKIKWYYNSFVIVGRKPIEA